MFVFIGGKGTGKTKALIERVKAEDGILACSDTIAMRERAYSYGITGLNIISYADLSEWYDKPIYIHDINEFIKYSFPEVMGYTINTN